MQMLFTEPKIGVSGKVQFVWFRFWDKNKGAYRKFKYTGGVNYSRLSKQERTIELRGLARAWKHRLEVDYFNPITGNCEPPLSRGNSSALTFVQALEFAKEKKTPTWSKKSLQDYSSVIKFLTEAAYTSDLADVLIRDFKRTHYKTILESAAARRKLSPIGFNKYRTFLSALIGELVQWDMLETNSVRDIKSQPEIKTIAHKPPTPDERKKIMSTLKKDHYPFYRFCSMLYGTTIREKEILALQVRDVNLKTQTINIIPDRMRDNSKVLTEREVIIPDSLLKILKELNVSDFPEHFYIFSTGYSPGPNRVHSNTPTLHWKRVVKDPPPKKTGEQGGLGIKKDLYGLKKLGGNDMINIQKEILDLIKMPQKQMGHTTSGMTEVYVTRHKELAGDLLKKNMPDL